MAGGRASQAARERAAPPTVLLVEDDVMVRTLLAESLRLAGGQVLEAANADEALILVASERPDVLVTDVEMPGSMDGLALVARIREGRPELKVIVTSGHAPAALAGAGADRFLLKPFDPDRLVRQVLNLSQSLG